MANSAREEFRASIDDALALVQSHTGPALVEAGPDEPLPSLLDQCLRMVETPQTAGPEPVRLLHQLACTGGTLLSRCIAAMPNTRLLSEVDPLSPLKQASAFLPADVAGLARNGSRAPGTDVITDIFLAGLKVLTEDCRADGLRLVLRDHAHGLFMHGDRVAQRPSLRDLLQDDYSLLSLVTVRHPIDSYLSLQNNKWMHFTPSDLAEYCRRYHVFLDYYSDVEIIRYEDFVEAPEPVMQQICKSLELPYDPGFIDTFSIIPLSGDSGRRGAVIAPRPRRSVPSGLRSQIADNPAYDSLCKRLGYTPYVA